MRSFDKGQYSFLPGSPFLSFGVRAHPGFGIVRVSVERNVDAAEALDVISPWLAQSNRPLTALCAVEFRQFARQPMTTDEFRQFNHAYVEQLREAGVMHDEGVPVARTNVVVEQDDERGIRLHAFCFTVPLADKGGRDFVLAAIPDVRFSSDGDEVIESGATSEEAFSRKLDFVLDLAEQRMTALDVSWAGVNAARLYAAKKMPRPTDPAAYKRFEAPRLCGLTWVDAVPPIGPAAIELDIRRTSREETLRNG